ncbi:MAG: YbhB/YbcL family Raf kinase inhibitor-like protein [Hylemonella sp.]|nr:YbhB/YbcL family Raf kinase inhibitor-like protein [Hylemonella sp.]
MRITHTLRRVLQSGLLLAGASLLAACASPSSAPPSATGFTLTSPGRADNAMLDKANAGKNPANPNCVGENITPALSWVRAPAGTRSFAIVMDDQAGRAGLGVNHWTAYGIAPTVTGLAEGEASASSSKLVAGKNTLGMAYLGPCPPRGNAPQHYVYTLIATSLAPDALPPGLNKAELMEALKGKALGAASLVLRYAH